MPVNEMKRARSLSVRRLAAWSPLIQALLAQLGLIPARPLVLVRLVVRSRHKHADWF